jgi:hypothetical protein
MLASGARVKVGLLAVVGTLLFVQYVLLGRSNPASERAAPLGTLAAPTNQSLILSSLPVADPLAPHKAAAFGNATAAWLMACVAMSRSPRMTALADDDAANTNTSALLFRMERGQRRNAGNSTGRCIGVPVMRQAAQRRMVAALDDGIAALGFHGLRVIAMVGRPYAVEPVMRACRRMLRDLGGIATTVVLRFAPHQRPKVMRLFEELRFPTDNTQLVEVVNPRNTRSLYRATVQNGWLHLKLDDDLMYVQHGFELFVVETFVRRKLSLRGGGSVSAHRQWCNVVSGNVVNHDLFSSIHAYSGATRVPRQAPRLDRRTQAVRNPWFWAAQHRDFLRRVLNGDSVVDAYGTFWAIDIGCNGHHAPPWSTNAILVEFGQNITGPGSILDTADDSAAITRDPDAFARAQGFGADARQCADGRAVAVHEGYSDQRLMWFAYANGGRTYSRALDALSQYYTAIARHADGTESCCEDSGCVVFVQERVLPNISRLACPMSSDACNFPFGADAFAAASGWGSLKAAFTGYSRVRPKPAPAVTVLLLEPGHAVTRHARSNMFVLQSLSHDGYVDSQKLWMTFLDSGSDVNKDEGLDATFGIRMADGDAGWCMGRGARQVTAVACSDRANSVWQVVPSGDKRYYLRTTTDHGNDEPLFACAVATTNNTYQMLLHSRSDVASTDDWQCVFTTVSGLPDKPSDIFAWKVVDTSTVTEEALDKHFVRLPGAMVNGSFFEDYRDLSVCKRACYAKQQMCTAIQVSASGRCVLKSVSPLPISVLLPKRRAAYVAFPSFGELAPPKALFLILSRSSDGYARTAAMVRAWADHPDVAVTGARCAVIFDRGTVLDLPNGTNTGDERHLCDGRVGHITTTPSQQLAQVLVDVLRWLGQLPNGGGEVFGAVSDRTFVFSTNLRLVFSQHVQKSLSQGPLVVHPVGTRNTDQRSSLLEGGLFFNDWAMRRFIDASSPRATGGPCYTAGNEDRPYAAFAECVAATTLLQATKDTRISLIPTVAIAAEGYARALRDGLAGGTLFPLSFGDVSAKDIAQLAEAVARGSGATGHVSLRATLWRDIAAR